MCADANSTESIFLWNPAFLLNHPGHVLWHKRLNLTWYDRLSPSGLFLKVVERGLRLKRAFDRRLNMRALLGRSGMLNLKLLKRLSILWDSRILQGRILLLGRRPLVKIRGAKLSVRAWLLGGYLVGKLWLTGPKLVLILPALLRLEWSGN
jgi:hypothetical protein